MDSSHHAQLFLLADSTLTPHDWEESIGDTEVTEFRSDTFSIGEVRQLITAAYTKPFEKATRTIVVRANAIGIEAQNALLKVLEEPPRTTRFIFILRKGCVLLPTVLSRFHSVDSGDSTPVRESEIFTTFLQSTIAERISLISETSKNKNHEVFDSLYSGLAMWLSGPAPITIVGKAQLLWCASILPQNGTSKKMVWEEIAFTLPVAKQ